MNPLFNRCVASVLFLALILPYPALALEGALGGNPDGSAYGGSVGGYSGNGGQDSPSESGPGPGGSSNSGGGGYSGYGGQDSPSEGHGSAGPGGGANSGGGFGGGDGQSGGGYSGYGGQDSPSESGPGPGGGMTGGDGQSGNGGTYDRAGKDTAFDVFTSTNGAKDANITVENPARTDISLGSVLGILGAVASQLLGVTSARATEMNTTSIEINVGSKTYVTKDPIAYGRYMDAMENTGINGAIKSAQAALDAAYAKNPQGDSVSDPEIDAAFDALDAAYARASEIAVGIFGGDAEGKTVSLAGTGGNDGTGYGNTAGDGLGTGGNQGGVGSSNGPSGTGNAGSYETAGKDAGLDPSGYTGSNTGNANPAANPGTGGFVGTGNGSEKSANAGRGDAIGLATGGSSGKSTNGSGKSASVSPAVAATSKALAEKTGEAPPDVAGRAYAGTITAQDVTVLGTGLSIKSTTPSGANNPDTRNSPALDALAKAFVVGSLAPSDGSLNGSDRGIKSLDEGDRSAGQGESPTLGSIGNALGTAADTLGYVVSQLVGVGPANATPRGIRNNNPGNIEDGQNFKGQVKGADGRFATFETPELGIRAMFVLFRTYETKHGLGTIAAKISRWAPPSENNTKAYINAVTKAVGVSPHEPFSITDPVLGPAFVAAIIAQENGHNPYSAEQIAAGYEKAFGESANTPQTASIPSVSPTPAAYAPTPTPAPGTDGIAPNAPGENGDGSGSGSGTGSGTGEESNDPGGTAVGSYTSPDGTSDTSSDKAGTVVESNGNATRSADVNDKLLGQLAYAGKQTNTYFVITSGGNPMSKAEYNSAKGTKSKIDNVYYLNGKAVRVGSSRHDHGGSVDGSIVDAVTGRTLDFSKPADQARIADFIAEAVKAGANGVGAAANYTGTQTVHIGGGSALAWGALGKAENVPGWVKAAHARGLNARKGFDVAELGKITTGHENTHNTPTGSTKGDNQGADAETEAFSFVDDQGREINVNPDGTGTRSNMDGTQTTLSREETSREYFGNDLTPSTQQAATGNESDDSSETTETEQGTQNPAEVSTIQKATNIVNGTIAKAKSVLGKVIGFITGKTPTDDVYADLPTNTPRNTSPYNLVITHDGGSLATSSVSHQVAPIINDTDEEPEEYDLYADSRPSIVLDEFGEIVYSDGTYAPRVIGSERDTTPYYYLTESPVPVATNERALPGNGFTRWIGTLTSDSSPFGMDQILTITFIYTDPDNTIANDEYKTYYITLTDGTAREVDIPSSTSLAYLKEQLLKIGYQGDVFEFMSIATETSSPAPVRDMRVVDTVTSFGSSVSSFVTSFFENSADTTYTDFGGHNASTDSFNDMHIIETTVYLDIPVNCPSLPGLEHGYVYKVILSRNGTDKYALLYTMCGGGSPESYAKDIAKHLVLKGHFDEVRPERILETLLFNFYEKVNTELADGTLHIVNTSGTGTAVADTNAITLEAKAVSQSGTLIRNWSPTPLTITSGDQIFIRWDGSAYRQCIPFLNDSGMYSLTKTGNTDMRTGNTETEKFDLFEHTGAYRIECADQSNGESGIDVASLSVMVH